MSKLQQEKVRVHPDDLVIDPELESFNLMRTDAELRDLEDEILTDKIIRDTITIWIPSERMDWIPKGMEGKPILVDGFSRHRIVKKHNLPIVFEAHIMDFEDREEAKDWIHLHQQNRRNLSEDQMAYYIGLQYNLFKNNYDRLVRFLKLKRRLDLLEVRDPERSNEGHTANILGKIYKNSNEKTIRRYGHYAHGIEIIQERNPVLADQILRASVEEDGKRIKVNRALVEQFSQLPPPNEIYGILDVQEVVLSSKKKKDKYHTQKEEIFLIVDKFLNKCTQSLLEEAELKLRAYYAAHSKDKAREVKMAGVFTS